MIRTRVLPRLIPLTAIALLALVPAQRGAEAAEKSGSGLPLPRFVSLRSEEVNLRAGPGVQYPVDWVYNRQNLPVQILAEYDTWRKVSDWQGTQGWVHQSMLTGRRTVMVTGGKRVLRRKPHAKSAAVADVEEGVIGSLLSCPEGASWCKVDIDGYVGWMRHVDFWGTFPNETVK